MHGKVLVTLRSGVLDPAGHAVADGLRQLGFQEVQGVRIGKVIEIELEGGCTPDEARLRVVEMSRALLANPVIEDFEVEITDEGHTDLSTEPFGPSDESGMS